MLWTGERCKLTGSYRTACDCSDTLELVAETEFPVCISCGQRVPWVYTSPPIYFARPAGADEGQEIAAHVDKLLAYLAQQSDRSEPAVLFALGKSLLRLGRVTSAVEVMYEVLGLIPWNASAYLELGKALIALREPIPAAEVLNRGISLAGARKDSDAVYEMIDLAEMAEEQTHHLRPNESDRTERVPLDIAITRSDGLAPGIYSAVNISEGGLCVHSPREEAIGDFVALDFMLDGDALRVYAKTVWCRSDLEALAERPYTVGLQFIAPSRSVTQAIAAYIENRKPEGGPCP